MLKRLFGGAKKPVQQTIARERRPAASRWAAVMPSLGRKVRVVSMQNETPDAVTVVIEPLDGGALNFEAGQYLTHCFDIDGEILRRAYSLSVAPGQGRVAFTCKRIEGGRVSAYVCDRLKPGDEYEIRGPSGDFVLGAGTQPLLFVAAGSGITPIISLIEAALQRDPGRDLCLLYASRDEQSIIFRRRLDELANLHANFRLVHVLSRPAGGWNGESGRLTAERVLALSGSSSAAEVYLCGPEELMQTLETGLKAAGFSGLHREAFTSANHSNRAHPTTAQTIRFALSKVSAEQQPGQSILDAAIAAGVPLNFSCTVGGCAACKVKVNSGDVVLDEPNCLSETEQGRGYTLACSAYALGPVEIEA